jgi:hypothetical protein
MGTAAGAVAVLLMSVTLGLGSPGTCRAAKERIPLPGRVYAWSFQADTLGQKPAHTVAFGGNWQVVEDSTDTALASPDSASPASAARDSVPRLPPASRHLAQFEGDDGIAYHYLTFTRPTLGDMDASVRFRIRAGEIDPSAGLMFQMDPKGTSGYLVRASGGSGELTFHYLLYGRRRDVKYSKIPALMPGTWHTIAIVRRKTQLHVSYDGKEVMAVRDDRFSQGHVGVWTEDDTVVDFEDLTATAR